MISRYILFDITSGLPTVITTSIEAYEQYKVYGSVIAVGVDETNLTEDALIMSTWHWTGSSIGSHSEQPGDYWVWNIPTWSYIFIAPAPVITVGAYSTLSEYRKITIYGNAVDTYWTTFFPIQLRTNTVDNFATATIITEDMGGSYTADNIEVTSRYYYLTPYYLDDYYNQVFGTTVSTGSVIPLAVETGDIGAGAVTGTKLAANAVTLLNTYTIPTGTIPSSLTLTTGTSAATYTAGSGTLTKTGTLDGWNASGYSTNGFTGGAQVSFTTVVPSSGSYMVGLNTDPATNAVYSTLDYAIYIGGATQSIYESNVQITRPGATNTYVAGDTFSVIYNGANLVNYYRNGILFYSTYVKTPITAALYMDSSFYETGTSCTNLKFNAYSAPVLLTENNLNGLIHAGNVGDHLSDNVISTKTVIPQSVSSLEMFSSDDDITNLEFDFTGSSTFYAGSLYITGDKYASTLVQVGLSNVQKTLTTFPVGISISLQSQYSIDNGMMTYNFTQEYEPSTYDNSQNNYLWYKTADYKVSFNAATAVDITTNVITTTASNFITGSEVFLENIWDDPTFVPIGGLIYGTSYFVIKLTSTTFKLAATLDEAKASIPIAVDLTSVGVSTHNIVSPFLTGQVYRNKPTRQFNVIPTSAGVNILTDTFTVSSTTPVWNTGIYTGMEVVYYNDTAGANIAPLVYGTSYYIIKVAAANAFKLATTLANAAAGVAINITAVSTGTLTHSFTGRVRWVLFNTASDFNISTHSLVGDSQIKSTSILDIAYMGDRVENTYHLYMTFSLGSVTNVTAFDPLTFSYVFSAFTSKR